MDQRRKRVSELGDAALELASSGRSAEAIEAYREVTDLAKACDHWSSPDYHVQLAQLLASTGDTAGADDHFQRALGEALRQADTDEASPSVGIVRYFMAEFLVSSCRSAEALQILAPALQHAPTMESILRIIETEALWSLNRRDDARRSADRALALAENDDQRARMSVRLKRLIGWTGPAKALERK
jgi:tetratricopeptide (TPR) repeat protein